jgi:hypothetical protein
MVTGLMSGLHLKLGNSFSVPYPFTFFLLSSVRDSWMHASTDQACFLQHCLNSKVVPKSTFLGLAVVIGKL